MLTAARCEVFVAALCYAYSLLLSWAALSFRSAIRTRGTVRTMCCTFPLETLLLMSWHQLGLVLPDTNRFSLCCQDRKN